MKILVFTAFFVVFSCKTTDTNSANNEKMTSETVCPSDGKCSFNVFYNKSINLVYDEFNNPYPKFTEDKSLILLEFEYLRNEVPNTADSHYIEKVFVQLQKTNLEQDLNNEELKNVKLTYARLCFCRGATGYYSINSGHLSIKKTNKNEYHFNLKFKSTEVSQIINEISENFIFKEDL